MQSSDTEAQRVVAEIAPPHTGPWTAIPGGGHGRPTVSSARCPRATDRTMTDLFSIAGKTALVTGGSRDIGKMIATGFVDAGARVRHRRDLAKGARCG